MDWQLSFSTITTAVTVIITLQAAFIAIGIVTERRHHASKLAWVLVLVLVPLLGLVLYFLFGRLPSAMKMRARRRANEDFEERILAPQEPDPAHPEIDALPPTFRAVANITRRTSGAALSAGNSVDIFSTGFSKFTALRAAVEQASEYIHLEYYIIKDDRTGRSVRDALIEAIRRGVQVRMLLDGAGCFYVPNRFFDPLREAGAQVATFLPIRFPFLTSRRDFRNHRKLVVIDGREAFLGGMNIGDEYSGYRGESDDPPTWRDTHAHVTGPCVAGLDEVFAEDWFHATGEPILRPPPQAWDPPPGDHVVQVVASGPDRPWPILQQVAFTVISGATRRINITTPYFIPDPSVLTAVTTAALSGVEVRLLGPAKSNYPLLQAAQRSYYEELLTAGVRIYEYEHGMIHVKSLVVDDQYALIGSANMDIRSFRLDFEIGLSLIARSCAERLNEDFENDLAHAREVTLDQVRRRSRIKSFAYSLAQLGSPLM